MIRLILPQHLKTLANLEGEISLQIQPPVTQRKILDALEAAHPVLKGTIRDHGSSTRRPLVRFLACGEDLSNESPDAVVPDAVAIGKEPFVILGAIAGG
jgi:molybdopterin synthase sulfur carrier subunit